MVLQAKSLASVTACRGAAGSDNDVFAVRPPTSTKHVGTFYTPCSARPYLLSSARSAAPVLNQIIQNILSSPKGILDSVHCVLQTIFKHCFSSVKYVEKKRCSYNFSPKYCSPVFPGKLVQGGYKDAPQRITEIQRSENCVTSPSRARTCDHGI